MNTQEPVRQPDIERPIDLNDNPARERPKPDERQPQTPTPPKPTD
ncbi:hypothetical protein [Actinoplanes derwentensis]|uniref:Uncharacterized protein n=1 Tax=Actinoplanes derwentensis TaxID=113562 RepID=A0A1H1SJ93_9ACTN|nr:hypothetical protein [Actinoplanes derwentensis]GID83293.1 hypothetical protein Ade03nite_22170 [Actinoplanes derwentensis]SDS47796.1 hypothetical protein SAMN04489716_0871 [Actinoplanes derwentensis]